MLELRRVSAGYGSVQVLRDVDIEVGQGEIVTIVGANGAGKTTLLRVISGLVGVGGGSIVFDGAQINGLRGEKIVQKGIAHVPEGRQLFAGMTVLENLELGAYKRHRRDGAAQIRGDLDEVFTLFPSLAERKTQVAGTLSGGEQQMLAVGRALMARPRLLLLDEPSMGLAPLVIERLFDAFRTLHQRGLTFLLVEQDATIALSIADRGYVLQTGRVMLHDTGRRLLESKEVRAIYFGQQSRGPGAGPA